MYSDSWNQLWSEQAVILCWSVLYGAISSAVTQSSLSFPFCFSHLSLKLSCKFFFKHSSDTFRQCICYACPINTDFCLWFIPTVLVQKQTWNWNFVVSCYLLCLQLPNLDKIINVKSMDCYCSKTCVYFSLDERIYWLMWTSLCNAFVSVPSVIRAQTMCISLLYISASLPSLESDA